MQKEIITKNNLNELSSYLINIIKERKDPFLDINIVVTSKKVEEWFKCYYLKNNDDVLMNVNFILLDNFIFSMFDLSKEDKLLTKDIFKLILLKELNKDDLDESYKKYIYEDNSISFNKLYDLANKLTELYYEYEKDEFTPSFIENDLFNNVINEAKKYNYYSLKDLLNKHEVKKLDKTYYIFNSLYLSNLYNDLINKISEVNDIKLLESKTNYENKENYKILSAPSKIKEIELIHSKIAKLLQDKSNSYNDFLVLAKSVNEYENEINRIFNQDNINFPSFPYSIFSIKNIDSNLTSALKILIDIKRKKYFTRLDFFNLINNNDIKKCRNINDEEIKVIVEAIEELNIYKDNDFFKDWDYLKKRLLLSKVSSINDINNNLISLKEKDYLPYSSISFNDELILKVVHLIDDLNKWIELSNSTFNLTNTFLDDLIIEFNKYFSLLDNNGYEMNKNYSNILALINIYKELELDSFKINIEILFLDLLNKSKSFKYNKGDAFIKGITFMDYDPSLVLSNKFVFFLNMNSKNYPSIKVTSELDERITDLNALTKEKEENSFFLYKNSSQEFYVSYISKDLKTDEDFYPSSFILDLIPENISDKEKYIKEIEEKINLDETRNYDELFTKKEYLDKNYYLDLFKEEIEVKEKNEEYDVKVDYDQIKKLNVKDFSDYLVEPLKYKAEKLFKSDSMIDEDIKEEYVPFSLNKLDESKLLTKFIKTYLINGEDEANQLYKKFELENKIPSINKFLNIYPMNKLLFYADEVKKLIDEECMGNYEFKKLNDLNLTSFSKEDFVITSSNEIIRSINGNDRKYFEIKKIRNKKDTLNTYLYDLMNLYIYSLIDLASLNNNESYHIMIFRNGDKVKLDFYSNKKTAISTLCAIYEQMNNNDLIRYFPIKFVYEIKGRSKTDIRESKYKDLVNDFYGENNNSWTYYDDKYLFDFYKDLGYSNDNKEEQFEEIKSIQKSLLLFLNNEEENKNE